MHFFFPQIKMKESWKEEGAEEDKEEEEEEVK